MIIYEGDSEVIKLDFSSNAAFESVSVEHNFGLADDFCSFDPDAMEVLIEPKSSNLGTFTLELKLTYDSD